MIRSLCVAGALAGLAFIFLDAGAAPADEAGARKYVDQAKKQLADKDSADTIETSLKLAEAELAGVGAEPKAALEQEIAGVRTQLKAAGMEGFKKEVTRELEVKFKMAEGTLGIRQAGIEQTFAAIEQMLNDPRTAEALGAAEVEAHRKKLATFRIVSAQKMLENDVAEATRIVEALEKQFPELINDLKTGSPNAQQGAAQTVDRRVQEFQSSVRSLPKDNAAVAALVIRVDRMKKEADAAYGAVMVAEVHHRLKRNWEIGLEEINGWETETTPPSLEQMTRESSQAMSKLGAPKTVAAAQKARNFFKSLATNAEAQPLGQTSPLKEFIESIGKLRSDSEAKLASFGDKILTGAEQMKLTQDQRNRLHTFVEHDLRLALEDHPQLAPLQARGMALVQKFDQERQASYGAKQAKYEALKTEAAAKWPELIKNVEAVEGFDPGKAGSFERKIIRLKNVRNRMGWDYGSDGGFDFAMDINGKPLAAHYSADVQKAIDDLEAETDKGLPEETSYDILAVYDGTKGTLMKRVERTAKVTGDVQGEIRGEVKEPVEDVPVLTIVGLYCGPVAVFNPAAQELALAGAGGGSSGGGFLAALFGFLIFALAGFVVLLKAEFAPIASAPQLGPVRANLTSTNQTIIGIALVVVGVLYLLRGYIIYGLIGNLALIAAGVYLALGLFERQSWWKPDLSFKLKQFAVPIGITLLVVAVLRLIFSVPFV